MITPATSSFATPSLADRIAARGVPGDSVNVITKFIWSINPHNTVMLESQDGTERVVWDDGVKRYLHQTVSCGKAIWTTQSEWRKNEAYDALKNNTHWIIPHLENHQDLVPKTVVADASPDKPDQTGQSSQIVEDVESSLAHENDSLVVDTTGNRSDDVCKQLISGTYPHTDAMIALIPTIKDKDRLAFPGGESIDDLHVTLGYFGDASMIPEEIQDQMVECVIQCVDAMPTVIGNAFSVNWFNPHGNDPCVVLGISGEQLEMIHRHIMTDIWHVFTSNDMTMHDQHSPWIPHITLKYTDDQSPSMSDYAQNRLGPVTFNRVRVAFGSNTYDIPLGDAMRNEDDISDDSITNDSYARKVSADTWDGIIAFDDNGDLVVPNVLIPLEALQEQDVDAPGGPGHSLRDYWTRGAGAAKIRWGTDGSFDRCVRFLREYVRDPEGLCASYHKEATGEWPAEEGVPSTSDTIAVSDETLYTTDQEASNEVALDIARQGDYPPGYVKLMNGECMSKGDVPPQYLTEESLHVAKRDDCPPGQHMMPNGECMDDDEMPGYDGYTSDSAPWDGILTVEGIESGDGRMFAANALTWDEPPLPLMWQKETSHGGDGDVSVRVGSIDRIWRVADTSGRSNVYNIMGEGTLDLGNPDGREVYRRMKRGYMRGNSVDVDSVKDADVEFIYSDDITNDGAQEIFARPDITMFTRGRIRATTLVEIPAFTEARLSLKDVITASMASDEDSVDDKDDITSAAAPRHKTDVVDSPWNASENLRRLPTPMPVSTGRDVFGWIQDDAINDGTMPKYAGRFPHHEVSANGDPGSANLTALSGTIGALNGARGGAAISENERRAVYNHVAGHMRDANVEPPPLKSFEAYTMTLFASAVPSHDTATTTGTWDSGEVLQQLPSPVPTEDARDVFAWIDMDRVEDGMIPKGAGKLPHHDVSADGTPGAANLTAVSAAIGALNGARGGVDMPEADRQATYNHLAAHLRDADREPPPLLSAEAAHVEALVAATAIIKVSDTPPREWFNEPTDVVPMGALTVTNDGRVYGYIAPANVRHRSFTDRAQYVPMKKVDYDRFMGGETIVADGGRVATGNITMDCGHATTAVNLSAKQASDHYDNTCSIVATVRVGENRDGVWVAGALLPGISADQIRRMMACRLSGDWRSHLDRQGWREFVAALLVPVPGFPMARQKTSASFEDGQLIASSVPVNFNAGDEMADMLSDVTLDSSDDINEVIHESVAETPSVELTSNVSVEINDNIDNTEQNSMFEALRERALATRTRIRALRLAHAKAVRAHASRTQHVVADNTSLNANKVVALRARLGKGE